MFPTVERPRITEIQVRIDCNGCVQKIKKVLHGINGIYDVYIDLPLQKLTILGWADPEKIIKAIKKARKTATLYSHCEVQDSPHGHPVEQPPPPNHSNPQSRLQPACPSPPDQSHPPYPDPQRDQQPPLHHHPHPRDVDDVHMIHHHPPGYRQGYNPGYNPRPHIHSQGYGPRPPGYNPGPHGHIQGYDLSYNSRPSGQSQGNGPCYDPKPPESRLERPQHVHVVQNYLQHMPTFVTQYEYVPSPPRYPPYARMDNDYNNNGDCHNDNNNNNEYPTSMFNEENPNACTIC